MGEAEAFVGRFVDFWDAPSPERLGELLHDDVVLTQPMAGPMYGLEAATNEFRRIWRWLPDMRAHVDRWRGDQDVVFIEFRLSATAGRRYIEWPNVDRFVLRDGKAQARMNYFDPLAVLWSMPTSPSLWWRWWASGAARPWRSGHGIVVYRRQQARTALLERDVQLQEPTDGSAP